MTVFDERPVQQDMVVVRGALLPITVAILNQDGTAYDLSGFGSRVITYIKYAADDQDDALTALRVYDSADGSATIVSPGAQGLTLLNRTLGDFADRVRFPHLVPRVYSVWVFPVGEVAARGLWTVSGL